MRRAAPRATVARLAVALAASAALAACGPAPAATRAAEPVAVARPVAAPATAAPSTKATSPPAAVARPAGTPAIDDLDFEGDRLTLVVAADGAARLRDGSAITDDDLARLVRDLRERRGDVSVVLAADGTLPYGRVIELMDLLRQAGVMRFSFAVAPKGP